MTAPPPDPMSVFADALDRSEVDRAAFLDAACGPDAGLRAEVADLLAAHARAGDFLPPRPAPPDGGSTATGAAAELGTRDWLAPPGVGGPADAPGTVLAGRYTLLRPLGEGGMGAVWAAQQTAPVKRLVAVKLIKAGMDSRAVLARFGAERQALAVMDHPHIAKVHDAGATPDGRPFFVMELAEGVTVTDYCDARSLTPRQRLELFVPVCEAVQHAHQKGVIHRDVKPSNVLVAEAGGKPVPKVIDFGVAKAAGPGLAEQTMHTGLGTVVGTRAYMAPEQAALDNQDVDTRRGQVEATHGARIAHGSKTKKYLGNILGMDQSAFTIVHDGVRWRGLPSRGYHSGAVRRASSSPWRVGRVSSWRRSSSCWSP